jgi:hypothetical protein
MTKKKEPRVKYRLTVNTSHEALYLLEKEHIVYDMN